MIRFLKSDLLLLSKLKTPQIQCFGRNSELHNLQSFYLRTIGTDAFLDFVEIAF